MAAESTELESRLKASSAKVEATPIRGLGGWWVLLGVGFPAWMNPGKSTSSESSSEPGGRNVLKGAAKCRTGTNDLSQMPSDARLMYIHKPMQCCRASSCKFLSPCACKCSRVPGSSTRSAAPCQPHIQDMPSSHVKGWQLAAS